MNAARAEIIGMHAGARDALVKFHQPLTLLEAPEKRSDRSYIEPKGADAQQVIQNPSDLSKRHPDVLRPGWRRDPHQLFDRLDYVSPMCQEHAFALAVEKLMGISPHH